MTSDLTTFIGTVLLPLALDAAGVVVGAVLLMAVLAVAISFMEGRG